MNKRMMAFVLGRILLTEAALLLLPLSAALLSGEAAWPWLLSMALPGALGCLLGRRRPRHTALYARDGFVTVALAWLLLSAFGAAPFLLTGDIPRWTDAFFETVSGFTTTGASILTDVEALSRGGLFWRSFTHWVGGMGVLVFVMAILPMHDGHSMHILRAEMPGPSAGKLVSRMSDTAKILYGIYLVMTLGMTLLLLLGGMDLFDACIHAFGTAGTGGFSSRNASIAAYQSPYIETVTAIGMLLFGINFNLYYFLLMGRIREVVRSEELWAYLGAIAFCAVTVAVNISPLYPTGAGALGDAFFQVCSIVTTTGYATADFNAWPGYSKTVLMLLLFIGGCAGSTAGGLKVARIVTQVKAAAAELKRLLHPNAVITVQMEGRPLPQRQVQGVQTYLSIYFLIFAAAWILLSLEGLDMLSTFSAVATCISNVGPGLGAVGPTGNFSAFSPWGKLLLSLVMLTGRLELFPMLLLFSPSVWRRR